MCDEPIRGARGSSGKDRPENEGGRSGAEKGSRTNGAAFLFLILTIAVPMAICARNLASAIEIGPDEHFEVTKALLWSRGYGLYTEVWNDQPPLLTVILGIGFKLFGARILVARIVAALFGAVLFIAVFLLVRKKAGVLAACASAVYLLVAPQVFYLSVSAMLEVPAFGMALTAALPIMLTKKRPSLTRIVMSACLIAVALQIKLTAAIVMPALAVEIVATCAAGDRWKGMKRRASLMAIWSGTILLVYLLLGWLLGSGYGTAWHSHFSHLTLESKEAAKHAFSFSILLNHGECVGAASVGIALMAIRRAWTAMTFPVTLLATVLLIHTSHRPWWDYYYLHIAIPFAWLAGYAVQQLAAVAWGGKESLSHSSAIWRMAALFGLSPLIASLFIVGGGRFTSEIAFIQSIPAVQEDALVQQMCLFKDQTRWAYSPDTIYPFHAGILVPPELAVIPAKRIWSGQLDDRSTVRLLNQYSPEQLLLKYNSAAAIQDFARSNYTLIWSNDEHLLYLKSNLRSENMH